MKPNTDISKHYPPTPTEQSKKQPKIFQTPHILHRKPPHRKDKQSKKCYA
ncbi:hypothetical protein HMPREF3156_01327 [Neisseria sp. HMSC06F02]|nr:hypothetical protein HMPREF3156_01327 [Neisseria sp. HMSC06F02]